MTRGYLAYRCPLCGGDQCGNDANAGWDVVTQQSVLLSEFDDQWCGECGEVTLEEYTVSDPAEIARIDAARAALAVEAAAAQLLAAAQAALMALTDRPAARAKDCVPGAIAQLTAAIALARFSPNAGAPTA